MLGLVDFTAGENIARPSGHKSVTGKWDRNNQEHMHELFDPPYPSQPQSELMNKIQKYFESNQFDLAAYKFVADTAHGGKTEADQKWSGLDSTQRGGIGY